MSILIAAFEPFGSEDMNASLEVQRALKASRRDIKTTVLPVSYEGAFPALKSMIDQIVPDVVIALGQTRGTSSVQLERLAVNFTESRLADNEGSVFRGRIYPERPAAYWSGLPLEAIALKGWEAHLPVVFSRDAGDYVCNHLFYQLMDYLAEEDMGIRAGFIHVPILPDQAQNNEASLPLLKSLEAIKIAVEVCEGTAEADAPLELSSGA